MSDPDHCFCFWYSGCRKDLSSDGESWRQTRGGSAEDRGGKENGRFGRRTVVGVGIGVHGVVCEEFLKKPIFSAGREAPERADALGFGRGRTGDLSEPK